jgi:phosphate transport system substrate-binding protein
MENQPAPATPAAGPAKRKVSGPRLLVIALVGTVLGLLIYFSPNFLIKEEPRPAHPRLVVGGTSAVFVIVENRWKAKYREEKGVQVVYESTGSSPGVKGVVDGTYPIAFTHGPLSRAQRKMARDKGKDLVNLPVLLCGVAPVYNVKALKGKAPLRLTGELLADIYLGKVRAWNDPALKAVNPGVDLPATAITVVHREDASGTTRIFTEYLNAVSQRWRAQVGPPASEVKWPIGLAAPRNLGVANLVDRTDGAIGYVDRMFTAFEEMVLDYAAVQNGDKTAFVRAEPENMTAAAAGLAQVPDHLSLSLANRPGKDAYPISAVVYAVCCQTQPEARRQQVVDFLRWAIHQGQPYAANMTYAPLPPELAAQADRRLETFKAAP